MSDLAKFAPKPPFANYDIVVYFGIGLLALPIIQHYYTTPLNLTIRNPVAQTGNDILNTILTILVFLFGSYLAGHGIAYSSAQFIQKSADNIFGKTSGVIIWESLTTDESRKKRTQELIILHLKGSFQKHNWPANTLRAVVHFPVIPLYLVIYFVGIFGYYGSRVPASIIDITRTKLKDIGLPDIPVAHQGHWFKPLEHYVMNNFPIATARMYNYLVISGLFRSISFLILIIIWLQSYFDIHYAIDKHLTLQPFLYDGKSSMPLWQLYAILNCSYAIALFSFLKFQRRYVEEAVFAFALTNDRDIRDLPLNSN